MCKDNEEFVAVRLHEAETRKAFWNGVWCGVGGVFLFGLFFGGRRVIERHHHHYTPSGTAQ